MRSILSFVVFTSFLGVVLAQDKILKIQIIIDDEQEEHPGSVYITNLHSQTSTLTDENGYATLLVHLGDELLFSSEFYEKRNYKITPEIYEIGLLKIHLNPIIIELETATLGFKLTGDLEQDAKNAGFVDSIGNIYQNLGIKEVDVPKPNEFGRPAGEGIFVEQLIGAITGYNKQQKRKFAFQKNEQKLEEIRNFFGDKFFVNELKLPKEKIYEFVAFAHDTSAIYVLIRQSNYLEAENLMHKLSQTYLNRLQNQKSAN